jgi:hypothetical protein
MNVYIFCINGATQLQFFLLVVEEAVYSPSRLGKVGYLGCINNLHFRAFLLPGILPLFSGQQYCDYIVDPGNTCHHEVTILQGNDAASLGTWFLMFQDNAVVSSLRVDVQKKCQKAGIHENRTRVQLTADYLGR